MKISQLRKKFKNKWVLAQVLKEDKLHRLVEVTPFQASEGREDVYKALSGLKKGSHVATIYTGQQPPKGMTFTFHVNIVVRP